jgi:hypothetical protein
MGYLKAYGMYAGVMSIFALMAVALYFKGKILRRWTLKYVKEDGDPSKPHYG